MNPYLALVVPAYGVTLVAVPVVMMIDQLGRGATPLHAIATLPLWIPYTLLFALPFVLAAAGLALLIQHLAGDRLHGRTGRLLFALGCAALGAAIMTLTIDAYALVAAAAGGTAAWLASSPGWLPRWRFGVVAVVGLTAGIILGVQYYCARWPGGCLAPFHVGRAGRTGDNWILCTKLSHGGRRRAPYAEALCQA